jgi:hypothetical protein
MEDERWIGVHEGGIKHQHYGILFTSNIVNQLIAMTRNHYQRLKILPVEKHL